MLPKRLGKNSAADFGRLVDKKFYKSVYKDDLAGLHPVEHFVRHAMTLNFDPRPDISLAKLSEKHSALDARELLNKLLNDADFLQASRSISESVFSFFEIVSTPELRDSIAKLVPVVDHDYYIDAYPDVAETWVPAHIHFALFGANEHRRPVSDFDVSLLEGGAACSNPLKMFLEYSVIREALDEDFYLESYPDVRASEMSPALHYVLIGWNEGRRPRADFDSTFYLADNTDVLESGLNPFFHFLEFGRQEDRMALPSTPTAEPLAQEPQQPKDSQLSRDWELVSPFFDTDFYLRLNADVRQSGVEPITHYLTTGWKENRDPSDEFDTAFYLSANADIAESGVNPFVHFVMSGKREGRICKHPGGFKAELLRSLPSIEERIEQWSNKGAAPLDSALVLSAFMRKILASSKNPNAALSFSHDDYIANTGGVQVCIEEEQLLFNERGTTYIHICPVNASPVMADIDSYDNWAGSVLVDGVVVGIFSASDIRDVFAETLGSIDTALVIHALHGHLPEFIAECHAAVKPFVSHFWVHDYFSLCPGYNLLRNDVEYCGVPDASSNSCNLCVYGERRPEHLKRMDQLFQNIDLKVVAPSSFALNLWKEKTELRHVDAIVHGHRTLLASRDMGSSNMRSNKLKIAFLGHAASHKGWQSFRQLAKKLATDTRYELFHLGLNPEPGLDLNYIEVKNSRDNPDAMRLAIEEHQIDIALVLSSWPETFCLTAYEAVAGGALIITTKHSGNVAKFVSDTRNGIVVGSATELELLFTSGQVFEQNEALSSGHPRSYSLDASGITAALVMEEKMSCNEEVEYV